MVSKLVITCDLWPVCLWIGYIRVVAHLLTFYLLPGTSKWEKPTSWQQKYCGSAANHPSGITFDIILRTGSCCVHIDCNNSIVSVACFLFQDCGPQEKISSYTAISKLDAPLHRFIDSLKMVGTWRGRPSWRFTMAQSWHNETHTFNKSKSIVSIQLLVFLLSFMVRWWLQFATQMDVAIKSL